MASRRLTSDRFFTTDYTPKLYTEEGLKWIDDNTMIPVLLRHYPSLTDRFLLAIGLCRLQLTPLRPI